MATMHIRKLALASALLVAAGLAAFALMPGGAAPVAAQGDDDDGLAANTISAPGVGTAFGEPDVAFVQLGVETTDTNITAALETTNQTMEEVIAALEEAGIPAEDIQTTRFDIQQTQDANPQTGQPVGQPRYTVTNVVRVRVSQIDQVGAVLQTALDAGANRVYGFQFDLSDGQALTSQARVQAVENARANAETLAEALGVELGDPVRVIEESTGAPPIPLSAGVARGSAETAAVPIEEGQLSTTGQVRVVWEIER